MDLKINFTKLSEFTKDYENLLNKNLSDDKFKALIIDDIINYNKFPISLSSTSFPKEKNELTRILKGISINDMYEALKKSEKQTGQITELKLTIQKKEIEITTKMKNEFENNKKAIQSELDEFKLKYQEQANEIEELKENLNTQELNFKEQNSQLTQTNAENVKQVDSLLKKIQESDQLINQKNESTNQLQDTIKDLQAQLQKNQILLEEQQSNFKLLSESSDSKNIELQNKVESLQKTYQDSQKELETSNQTLINLSLKNTENEQKINTLSSDVEDLKNVNQTYKEQVSIFQQQYKDLEYQITLKDLEFQELQQKFQDAHLKINSLMREKEKLNKLVPLIDESKYGYDIIIKMKSIKNLQLSNNKSKHVGLRVQQFNEKIDQNFENVMIIGTQGQRNAGKSFLLNSLIDENFPSDFHLSTPGICLKYHSLDQRNIIYLDSEGLNTPITIDYDNNQNYRKFLDNKKNNRFQDTLSEENLSKDITERHQDLKATEQIQQEFIVESSDILMIVVSQLTLEDQKLIQSLQQKFLGNTSIKKDKKIIVIHNLKEFHRPEYVKGYTHKIKKYFPVQEIVFNSYAKTDDDESNLIFIDNLKGNIHHVVMGNSGSEAGRVYNRFALYYIKHQIGMYVSLSNFNVQKKLQDYMNRNLEKYVNLQQRTDEQTQDPEINGKIQFNQELQALVLSEGFSIDKIKEFEVNIYGSISKYCSYSIVDSRDNKDERYLLIEIPCGAQVNTNYEKISGNFSLTMQLNKDIELELGEICFSTRKFESQTFPIKIANNNELWDFNKNKSKKLPSGIEMYVFNKEIEEDFS